LTLKGISFILPVHAIECKQKVKYMKKSKSTRLVIAVMLVGGVIPYLALGDDSHVYKDEDWPMFMHDYQNTGYSGSAAPDSLYLLWTFDTGQRLFASPVVCNGTVYQAGRGSLFALDSETGDLIWSSELPVVGSTPFVAGDSLYVGTCNGIAAVNSKTGGLLWEVQLVDFSCNPWKDETSFFLSSSPIATDTGVIMCTHRNMLYDTANPHPEGINEVVCLDVKDGTCLWRYRYIERAGYSPALLDKLIVLNSDQLRFLDVRTGQQLWSYETGFLSDTSPVITQSTLVTTSSEDGTIYAFDIKVRDLLWTRCLNDLVFSTPAVHNNRIIQMTYDESLYVLDEKTGSVVWKKDLWEKPSFSVMDIAQNRQAGFSSSPAVADNKIYVGLASGTFMCLKLDTGDISWKYRTEGSIVASPAVADERVFVASTDGKVYCFGIDPATYFQKAEEYRKQKDMERAREFYLRAEEYFQSKGDLNMVRKCQKRLSKGINTWLVVPLGLCILGGLLILYKKKSKGRK
jgi:outer membrane protein assembly factor BamB